MDLQFTALQPTVRILPTTEDNIDLLFVCLKTKVVLRLPPVLLQTKLGLVINQL